MATAVVLLESFPAHLLHLLLVSFAVNGTRIGASVVRILEGPTSASERIALVSLQDTNQVTAERTRHDPG